jgi:c-di-GMP-binding flagellar brake protein YcgR
MELFYMSAENRRNHFRVEILVPVRWQILNNNEIEIFKNGGGDTLLKTEGLPNPIDDLIDQATPGSESEQLYQALKYINNKLDFIIEEQMSASIGKQSSQDDVIEISASGLKFFTKEKLDQGNLLKMSLILPGTFQYQMDFIARTMRIEKNAQGYVVAAKFLHISDDSRDSIINVVFQKQRLDIRNKKK